MQFDGQLAAITGGSSGIGLALGRQLAERGASVWLLARDENNLQRALQLLEEHRVNPGQQFGIEPLDVADNNAVLRAAEIIQVEVGVPDLVVNNAGVAHPGYVEELDLEIFRWMMEVNYFGTVQVTKAFLPAMLERGSGHILNVSSIAGFVGVFGHTAYGASKFAVRGFSDALRAELKPKGVGVSILYPPDTDTPQLEYENQFKPPETAALAGGTAVMDPESVARTALRGIERGRYVIIPGWEGKLMYWLAGAAGTLTYPIIDWMLARTTPPRETD